MCTELTASGRSKGWIMVMDCTGVGLVNANLDSATFLNSTLQNYFLHGQLHLLNYQSQPIMDTALKSAEMAMLPSYERI